MDLEHLKDLLEIALIVGGVYKYWVTENWRQVKYVADEMTAFDANPQVINTKLMLDWDARYIELFPESADPTKRRRVVTNDDLKIALTPHSSMTRVYTVEEAAIRDNFDCFLTYLERFHAHLKTRLITKKRFEPYLKYWIDLMANKGKRKKDPEVLLKLWSYIEAYEYNSVEELIQEFYPKFKVDEVFPGARIKVPTIGTDTEKSVK